MACHLTLAVGLGLTFAAFVLCVVVSSEIQVLDADTSLTVLALYAIGLGLSVISVCFFKAFVYPDLDDYDVRVILFFIRSCFPSRLREKSSSGCLRRGLRVSCVLSVTAWAGCFLSYFVIWIMMLTLRVKGMEVHRDDVLIATVMLGLSLVFAFLTVILVLSVWIGLDAEDLERTMDWAMGFLPDQDGEEEESAPPPPSEVPC
jgi:hypothetical protein